MLQLPQEATGRLVSLSPRELESRIQWITSTALVVGFLLQGAHGVSFTCMLLCVCGFFVQYAKNYSPRSKRITEITQKSPFSFKAFFLSAAAGSMVFMFLKQGIGSCMQDMASWALLFCLVSTVTKFTPREWRWIIIGALMISFGYIASVVGDVILHTTPLDRPTGMHAALPITFNSCAISALFLISLPLVGIGRLSRLWSGKGETLAGCAHQSILHRFASYLRRAAKQCVAELPVYAFLAWYAGIVFFLSFPQGSVGDMLADQFIVSARDANIYPLKESSVYSKHSRLLAPAEDPFADGVDNPPAASSESKYDGADHSANQLAAGNQFDLPLTVRDPGTGAEGEIDALKEANAATFIVKCLVAVGLSVLPFSLIMRTAAFYAALMRRLMGATGKLGLSESTLAAVRATGDKLRLKYESRFFAHAARTFWWLLFWYAVVFCLVAFTGGGLGIAIRNWLDFSIVDSGLRHVSTEYNLNMRYFMAAVLAMYASGPLAVTGCVFLPHRAGRRIIVNEDGISAPDGPFASMWLRTFRLYVDIKSVTLNGRCVPDIEYAKDKRRVNIRFRTGGSLSFRVMDMPPEDLRLLLERIDEHAEDCEISADIADLRVKLSQGSQAKSSFEPNVRRGKFKSSIFVPYAGGEKLETHGLRIVKVLANKPLSAVYLVRLASGKLAVLKQLVMPKDDDLSKEHLRIFQRECEVMRALKHEGIAGVIDAFREENNHFLLLEHFKGHDLKFIIDTYGARNIEDVATWALSLCDVLEYLHSKDIIHRDVTPENIVVGEHEGARLIDFGAAHQFIEGITGTLIGKQSYVAPEQLRGKASKRSDIYSLGVTMNYLLTAKEPVALMQCEPELGSSNSARLMSNLIKSMTDFEEELRPENIQAVRQILLSVLNKKTAPAQSTVQAPVSETPPGPESVLAQISAVEEDVTDVNAPASDAEAAARTIQLMAAALPEPTLKVRARQKKKVKVERQANQETPQ